MDKRVRSLTGQSWYPSSMGSATSPQLSFDAQSPDLSVGLSPNPNERVRRRRSCAFWSVFEGVNRSSFQVHENPENSAEKRYAVGGELLYI